MTTEHTLTPLTQEEADELARLEGSTKAVRATDTHFDKPYLCWLIYEEPDCAIVVYDDDPKCSVSTGNHEGRFIRAALTKAGAA